MYLLIFIGEQDGSFIPGLMPYENKLVGDLKTAKKYLDTGRWKLSNSLKGKEPDWNPYSPEEYHNFFGDPEPNLPNLDENLNESELKTAEAETSNNEVEAPSASQEAGKPAKDKSRK